MTKNIYQGESLLVGSRVRRGSLWSQAIYGDQDGGTGSYGTVTGFPHDYSNYGNSYGGNSYRDKGNRVSVLWDNGYEGVYRLNFETYNCYYGCYYYSDVGSVVSFSFRRSFMRAYTHAEYAILFFPGIFC